ncbi:RICIN domain-containing protein [Nonomuraea sp. NPDC048881]|uniref:RICIN domain-containing protein n=1 Tax=Nonomuraea sp. NPDC048881 TaxID=3155030 RepID=UPI0033C76238
MVGSPTRAAPATRRTALFLVAVLLGALHVALASPAQALTGETRLHDPSVMKVDSCYYAFSTGFAGDAQNPNGQILRYRSCGSATGPWTKLGTVFDETPAWVTQRIGRSNFGNVWSPEIQYFNGRYHLYYSVARSTPSWAAVLGVATATDIEGPYTDQGFVTDVEFPIDPTVNVGGDGRMYITWGSFGGIYQHVLDPATGKLSTTDHNLWHLAADMEGVTIVQNGGYYYLFGSRGPCCNGVKSNYWTVVGRSTSINGPYVDMAGVPLTSKGGTTVLTGSWPKTSAGGGDAYTDGPDTYLAYHYYDADNGGRETLDIRQVTFAGGWPVLGTPLGETSFHLLNQYSRMCADVWNLSTADGAPVKQGFCNSGANQRWSLTPAGGNMRIVNQNSGKCLEISGSSTAARAPAVQAPCDGGANQQWTRTATYGAYMTFKNVNSGMCLEVYGNSTTNGAALNQWPCNGGPNQQWLLG